MYQIRDSFDLCLKASESVWRLFLSQLIILFPFNWVVYANYVPNALINVTTVILLLISLVSIGNSNGVRGVPFVGTFKRI